MTDFQSDPRIKSSTCSCALPIDHFPRIVSEVGLSYRHEPDCRHFHGECVWLVIVVGNGAGDGLGLAWATGPRRCGHGD
jgi:hypothetical protein